MKKIFFTITCFCLIIISFFTTTINAKYERYVIPGGESIGLKIETGVEVVGKYNVETTNGKIAPWKQSDIEIGDIITKINNIKINSNDDLIALLKSVNGKVLIEVKRDNKILKTYMEIVTSKKNEKTLGLYIKDKILGVGTLSFYDNDKDLFCALGHGIYENNELINLNEGNLTWSTISGIKKASIRSQGEKRGVLDNGQIGNILKIKNTGIYGRINTNEIPKKNKLKIADIAEVKTGKAKICTVINQNIVETFNIEILNTYSQSTISTKGLKIKVTDSTLLDETGGIIQGMSGSPIIQNDMIIGVVSHVTIENPAIGYAMYAKWMAEEMYNSIN